MNSSSLEPITPPVEDARHDGEELLDSIEAKLVCVSMDAHARRACALWAVLTHVFDAFDWTPRLVAYAPAPQSGKSTLLERLAGVVARPDICHDLTPAVFFRDVDEFRPTTIFDDYDSLIRPKKEALLNVFNSGFSKSGSVKRVERGITRRFRTFAPLAIGTNERLPVAASTRSIYVYMQRPRRDENVPPPLPFDSEAIRQECERWAERNRPLIPNVRLTLPADHGMDSRQADCWFPLHVVAHLCGPKWAKHAIDAARKLCAEARADAVVTEGVALLRDISEVFAEERMFGRQLSLRLRRIEDAPWNEHGLTPNKLAILLRPFRIVSKQIRVGAKTGKGYLRSDFDDAWSRYLQARRAPDENNGGV